MATGTTRAINVLGGWTLLLAVALGGVYAYWVTQGSGEEIARLPLESARKEAPEGRLGPVALGPGMSPVRALLEIDFETWNVAGSAIRWDAAAFGPDGGRLWFEEGRTDTQKAGDNTGERHGTTIALPAFNVARAGNYQFEVDAAVAGNAELSAVDLVLRANAARVDPWVVGGLLALAVIGYGLGRRRRGA